MARPSRASGAAVNSVQNPAYRRRHGGALCRGRAPQPDGADAAGRGPGGGGAGHGRLSSRCRSSTRSACCCRSCRSTSAISWCPAPRSRWKSPHLAGFSTDQRPYELWAKAAIQDLTDPDHVELKTLRAKVMMEDKSTVTMDARTGFFDSKQQMLDLRKDIFLQSSTGYEAKLSQAYRRHQQGNGDVGRACRRQIAERNAHRRQAQDHQQRRGRAFRRQCRDEPESWKAPPAPEPEPEPRRRRRRGPSPASPPTRNDFHDAVLLRAVLQRSGVRARADRLRRSARAQGAMSGVPNAMQGFSQNRDQPIQIEAASLEMRDKKKEATFSGNVKVVQGDTTMTSKTLVVFYDSRARGDAAPRRARRRREPSPAPMQSATPGPAAVRRSSGWKRRATSWSPRRTRS